MAGLLWICLLASLYVVLSSYKVLRWLRHQLYVFCKLAEIPGPEGQPLLGIAHKISPDSVLSTYQMEYFFRIFTNAKDAEGILKFYLGPKPVVVLYRAETIKPLMENPAIISKTHEYDYIKDWLGEGLLTSTNEKWRHRRKIITPAFHFASLITFIKCFNRQGDILMQNLTKHAEDGYPFDAYKYFKALALDVICEAAMGVNVSSQTGENAVYVKSVKTLCELLWLRIRSPWLWPKLLWYATGYGVEFDRARRIVTDFTKKVIAERKAQRAQSPKIENNNDNDPNKRTCFLDILLQMQDEFKLTDEDIREEVDTFMFEGHDTVSNCISFFIMNIADREDIQARIRDELDEIFEEDDRDRRVSHADILRMNYLEKCIKETMRMFPLVPMIGRTASEEIKIKGYTIPEGVTVMVAPFAAHRDPNYFHNPDYFDPSHFDEENVASRSPFTYIPFSAGYRNCIGQRFAMMQLKVVLSKIFSRFRVIGAKHQIENRGLTELVLKPNKGCWIRLEERKQISIH
ncbi:unnamed protein product [Bursaphelenchus xylophilus]|uniref:(pine wood nematode) hypothetical protein n=1 Tax=Bursaphelenchus xylophilus TaxID=6326 RepID=A0A1I7RIM6_BURXY|nr:unnamed protein product [Bursaphelenchus xylophilus]CAG9118913.1 unnamed protein product [Bursaphelenchus xylophilus]